MNVPRATKTIYIEISFPKIAHDSRIRSAYNIHFAKRERQRERERQRDRERETERQRDRETERERERENSQNLFYKDCCLDSVKNNNTLIDI